MKHLAIIVFFVWGLSNYSLAQIDSTSTIDLSLDEFMLDEPESVVLLPEKMIFTQRILWGNSGLLRNFSYFELTPEKRQRELGIRRNMLGVHQILGFATLGGMIAQGFVGAQLYKNGDLKGLHEGLGVGVNFGYFTTASLALFAPPKMLSDGKGYSSIKLHKVLGIVHFTSMIATNLLAGPAANNVKFKPYHRAAAFTAFGSFAVSMIVIKF